MPLMSAPDALHGRSAATPVTRPGRRLPHLDRNGWLLVAGKGLRSFAFGLNAVTLGLYLAASGLPTERIGWVLSSALLGTMALTLMVTFWGDRFGRRRSLIAGSLLMSLAALIPLVAADPLLLAVLGLSGMVAVTSHEATGLQSLDQAALPQTVPPEQRTHAFALYNLVAVAASAGGSLAAGLLPHLAGGAGMQGPSAYVPAFLLYALTGIAAAAVALRLDAGIDLDAPLARGLAIHRSRGTVARLSVLFGLDALAGSFVVQSFLAYWFSARFGADPVLLGATFLAAGILAAVSFPVAAWLASRIGLIQTMVFTHIPANLFLVATALSPALPLAIVFFLARAALSSMDVPARQSYTMAVVDADERTAAAGVTSLARSVAQVPGPALAGLLLVPLGIGSPLIAAGALKIAYDLALFASFRTRLSPEEAARRLSRAGRP